MLDASVRAELIVSPLPVSTHSPICLRDFPKQEVQGSVDAPVPEADLPASRCDLVSRQEPEAG